VTAWKKKRKKLANLSVLWTDCTRRGIATVNLAIKQKRGKTNSALTLILSAGGQKEPF
jgi:hypothetical protein